MHFDVHNPDNNLYYYKAYIDKQILTSASACEMNMCIYTQDFLKQKINI